LAVGRAGLRPGGPIKQVDERAAVEAIQGQMLAYDKALWRCRESLERSRDRLDEVWDDIATHRRADGLDQVGARETAAQAATARWCTAAALAREESRGMHQRVDAPQTLRDGDRRLLVGGIDQVWTRYETPAVRPVMAEAAP